MKSFNILHLSDLHISELEDPSSQRLRESLIQDVEKMVTAHNIKLDVIAMTGDTVDKGGNSKAFSIASEFYNNLLDKLSLTEEKLLLVPGNHDIPRREPVRLLIEMGSEEDFLDESRFSENWGTLETRFNSYYNFLTSVTGIEKPASNFFGGDSKTIKTNNGVIKFLLLNSSWACTGEKDYANLRIGRWQLERLKQKKESNDSADLTIALMHHPLDWLERSDRQFVIDYLTNEYCLPVDILLHGHIHDSNIESFMNPDKRLTSFVTGVGYPDKEAKITTRTKVTNCRYSLYTIDVIKGEVKVVMRVSNKNGTFVADTLSFDKGGETGVLVYEYKKPTDNLNKVIAATQDKSIINNMTMEVDSVKLVHEWVGRHKELSILEERKLSVLAITGMGGQGKSALASEYLRRYSRGENTLYEAGVWIDCRELHHSLHIKIIESLDKISGGAENVSLFRDEMLEDTIKRFIKHLQQRKMLIVFDNIDAYVKADTEGPTLELKPFFDSLLNVEHSSLVILTSRNPLTHDSAAFFHIKLNGLTKEDGLSFLEKRSIEITPRNKSDCEEIIKLTHGHPWWLGLIAGQISNSTQTIKESVIKLRTGYGSERERIQQQNYFNDVWGQLNDDRKKILRYLVEVHRPLTDFEIASFGKGGPSKIKQELRRIGRLGLVETHEGMSENEISYQVHPLLREFVHGTYSAAAQESYVQKVLYIFLPRALVDALFIDFSSLENLAEMNPKELLDSIETCLLSRNPDRALGLLEQYKEVLTNKGYHHQFQSLACRVLDEINWEENNIFGRYKGVQLLVTIIQLLNYMGENLQAYYYLKKYETSIEFKTIAYLKYIELAADIAWRDGQFIKCIEYIDEFEGLAEKLQTTDGIPGIKYLKALAYRDSGDKVKEALILFDEIEGKEEKEKSHAYLGNKARCYYILKEYPKAEKFIKQSLIKILSETSYYAHSNLGFAYLWLVEIMYEQGKLKESRAFFNLVKSVWEEYAPGLLYKVNMVMQKYETNKLWNEIVLNPEEVRNIENDFLKS